MIITSSGKDSVVGGAGFDSIKMTSNLDVFDPLTVVQEQTPSPSKIQPATTDLDNVSGIEVIELGAAETNIKLADATIADGASLTFIANASSTKSVTIDASEEDGATPGTVAITGAKANDTFTGGNGADTLTGAIGADSLKGGLGADTFVNADIDTNGVDIITDFATTTDKVSLSIADLNALTGAATFTAGNGGVAAQGGAFVQIVASNDNSAADQAATAAGTIIYDSNTGNVIFDASGDTTYTDDGTGFTDAAGDDVVFADLGTPLSSVGWRLPVCCLIT